MSSLYSSESLGSVVVPTIQTGIFNESNNVEPLSSVTDLDETIKSPISKVNQHSTPSVGPNRRLHMAQEVIERYDEGVFDECVTNPNDEDENNSVVIGESDDEDEIEHFDSTDSITISMNQPAQRSNGEFLSINNSLQTCLDNTNEQSIDNHSINLGNNT